MSNPNKPEAYHLIRTGGTCPILINDTLRVRRTDGEAMSINLRSIRDIIKNPVQSGLESRALVELDSGIQFATVHRYSLIRHMWIMWATENAQPAKGVARG